MGNLKPRDKEFPLKRILTITDAGSFMKSLDANLEDYFFVGIHTSSIPADSNTTSITQEFINAIPRDSRFVIGYMTNTTPLSGGQNQYKRNEHGTALIRKRLMNFEYSLEEMKYI